MIWVCPSAFLVLPSWFKNPSKCMQGQKLLSGSSWGSEGWKGPAARTGAYAATDLSTYRCTRLDPQNHRRFCLCLLRFPGKYFCVNQELRTSANYQNQHSIISHWGLDLLFPLPRKMYSPWLHCGCCLRYDYTDNLSCWKSPAWTRWTPRLSFACGKYKLVSNTQLPHPSTPFPSLRAKSVSLDSI